MIEIDLEQAQTYVIRCIKQKLVPYLKGHPGVGKSDILRKVAAHLNLYYVDIRLSTFNICYLMGMPDTHGERARFKQFDIFPTEDSKIPDGYKGWLVNFDELSSVNKTMQAAAYRVILDREVGDKKLHKLCFCTAAGNLASSNAHVNPMSTAMQSRIIHFNIRVSRPAWLKWAAKNDIDYRVTGLVEWKEAYLNTFDPKHNEDTYACPRTLEFLSRLTKGEEVSFDDLPLFAGTVSEGVAREFIAYCDFYKRIPKIEDIIEDPDLIAVPEESGLCFALATVIAENMTEENGSALMTYIKRLGIEFQVTAVRKSWAKNRRIVLVPEISDWLDVNGTRFA